jgi:hypothetical protein
MDKRPMVLKSGVAGLDATSEACHCGLAPTIVAFVSARDRGQIVATKSPRAVR